MNDSVIRDEAAKNGRKAYKRLKWTNLLLVAIVLLLIAGRIVWSVSHKEEYRFTPERWEEGAQTRGIIVTDLLSHYELYGMSEEEVKDLLGSPDREDDTRFVYELGETREGIRTVTQYLVLYFPDGTVETYEIVTDVPDGFTNS